MVATRSDCNTSPLPEARTTINLERMYSLDEFDRMKDGVVSESMDDKWFVFFEDPWLYCHRSWTGVCYCMVRFKPTSRGVCTEEILANRNREQYGGTDDDRDSLMVTALLDELAGREALSAWERYFDSLSRGHES